MPKFDKSEITIKFWKKQLDFVLKYPEQLDAQADEEGWYDINDLLKKLSDYKKDKFDFQVFETILKWYTNKYKVNRERTKVKLK